MEKLKNFLNRIFTLRPGTLYSSSGILLGLTKSRGPSDWLEGVIEKNSHFYRKFSKEPPRIRSPVYKVISSDKLSLQFGKTCSHWWSSFKSGHLIGRGADLGVDADDLAALVAIVGEDILVALDAIGMVISQHIPAQPSHTFL